MEIPLISQHSTHHPKKMLCWMHGARSDVRANWHKCTEQKRGCRVADVVRACLQLERFRHRNMQQHRGWGVCLEGCICKYRQRLCSFKVLHRNAKPSNMQRHRGWGVCLERCVGKSRHRLCLWKVRHDWEGLGLLKIRVFNSLCRFFDAPHTYIHPCAYTHVHAHAHAQAPVHVHARAHVHTNAHAGMYAHRDTQNTQTQKTHADTQTHKTHADTQTQRHKDTRRHT